MKTERHAPALVHALGIPSARFSIFQSSDMQMSCLFSQ